MRNKKNWKIYNALELEQKNIVVYYGVTSSLDEVIETLTSVSSSVYQSVGYGYFPHATTDNIIDNIVNNILEKQIETLTKSIGSWPMNLEDIKELCAPLCNEIQLSIVNDIFTWVTAGNVHYGWARCNYEYCFYIGYPREGTITTNAKELGMIPLWNSCGTMPN